MDKYQGRSRHEVDRQKSILHEIGIHLVKTEQSEYNNDEFSTVLKFNFTPKPLKNSLETTLLGFEELDEFIAYDSKELYHFFEHRFPQHLNRMINPDKKSKKAS